MLFKPEHVPMILEGRKTRTRRLWGFCRVKVGGIYKAKTQMLSKTSFARLKITSIKKEKLIVSEINSDKDLDAQKEGYATWDKFKDIWVVINGSWNQEDEPYVIDFEVVR